MPLGKNLISTGKLNKMNLHINTEQNTLYSTHQQTGCVIEPAYNLLTLPCTIHNAMVHLNINYAGNKRKASDSALLSAQMLTRQNAFLQEPEYQEDMKLDTGRFKQLNGKFGPFEVELFASKTNNLLLQFACIVQRWDMHRSCHVFFRFDNVLWSGCNCFSVCSYATHDLYFVVGRLLSVCWLHQIGAFFMLQCLYCLSVPGVFPHAGFCATCG